MIEAGGCHERARGRSAATTVLTLALVCASGAAAQAGGSSAPAAGTAATAGAAQGGGTAAAGSTAGGGANAGQAQPLQLLPMPPPPPAAVPAVPPGPVLTLTQAEQMAVAQHPLLAAASFNAQAAAQELRVSRAAYFPVLEADFTGAGALPDSRLAAGLLNNPTVYNRYANGLEATQLISDFGRTGALVKSARLYAQAETNTTEATRQNVLLGAAQAYFDTLRAQALLQVAEEAVDQRQQVSEQVTALAQAQLRSELDAHLANVDLAQSRVDLSYAQAAVQTAFAQLATALGLPGPRAFTLQAGPVPAPPAADVQPLIATALSLRPDLIAARLQTQSAQQYANAQRDLSRPTLSAVGEAGTIPFGESPLSSRYAAIGANLSVPIFNGSQFAAEHAAAVDSAQASSEQERQVEDTVSRDVYNAWLNARTGYQQLALTQELLDQASMAFNLAQSRYQLGLGTIVELTQSQLNLTQAQTQHANAIYDYEILTIALQFEMGELH